MRLPVVLALVGVVMLLVSAGFAVGAGMSHFVTPPLTGMSATTLGYAIWAGASFAGALLWFAIARVIGLLETIAARA